MNKKLLIASLLANVGLLLATWDYRETARKNTINHNSNVDEYKKLRVEYEKLYQEYTSSWSKGKLLLKVIEEHKDAGCDVRMTPETAFGLEAYLIMRENGMA